MTAPHWRTIPATNPSPLTRALIAGLLSAAAAWSAVPAHAAWQNWRAAQDGLANNQVLSVAEAADGAMLFGTLNGASRFDGLHWTTYADSLPSRSVMGYIEDRRGQSWFATLNGLAMWDGAHWKRWHVTDGVLPSEQLNCILEDHRGDLWVGTSAGLVRYQPGTGTWTTYAANPGPLINSKAWQLLEDRENRLWVATPRGASCLDSSRTTWTNYLPDPEVSSRDSVLALGEDSGGSIWLGTYQGAYRLASGHWSYFTHADGLPSEQVTAFTRDGTGNLWVGGFAGVARWDGRTFRQEGQGGSDSLGYVQALGVDHSGNVWAATREHGVSRYDGVTWNYYFSNAASPCPPQTSPGIPAYETLPSNCVSAMLQDGRGDAWFATANGGMARLGRNGRTWSTVGRSPGVPVSDSVTALAEDHGGALWFASQAAGVAVLDSTNLSAWTLYQRTEGLASDSVVTLYVDGRGDVWAGTTNGASRWHAGEWSNFLWGGVLGVPVEVDQLLEDTGGRLWLRTTAGLWSLDVARTQLKQWSTADGLAADVVICMQLASDGAVWFGTEGGASRLRDGVWTSWTTFGGFGDGYVNAIAEDSQGRIWVGTSSDAAYWNGASWWRFSLSQLGSLPVIGFAFDASGSAWLATGEGVSRWNGNEWRRYDSHGNGLASFAVAGFLQDSQRRLWFGASTAGRASGLTEFEPDRTAPQTVVVNRPPALSPLRNVAFSFGAAYGETANLEYSTAWDGGAWTPWTGDNTWSTSGVADGIHTFAVRARDWARNVDSTAATYRFEVDASAPEAAVSVSVQPVRGRVAVTGTAADVRFASWLLQARPDGVTSWTDSRVRVLATGTRQVQADTLAIWDTAGLAEGNWDLRLSVADTLGLVGSAQLRAIVDNLPPYADVTSPVRIVAREGGEVFTTQGEVHLYFPPGAFDADVVVSVDSLAAGAAPGTLPGGAVRMSAAWAIEWSGGRMLKAGVLELRPDVGAAPAAVFRADTGGTWRALGGTELQGRLSLALARAGRYAVFSGGVAPAAGSRIAALRLSPRAFSPGGNLAAREVAITFQLAAPGTAAVRVYNRAGRLVREVARNWPGIAGENLVRWDGRDANGRQVESGLYIVSIEALGESRTQTLGVMP